MAFLVVSALGIARIARSIRASNSRPAVRILFFALDVEMASCSGSTSLSNAVAANAAVYRWQSRWRCWASSHHGDVGWSLPSMPCHVRTWESGASLGTVAYRRIFAMDFLNDPLPFSS